MNPWTWIVGGSVIVLVSAATVFARGAAEPPPAEPAEGVRVRTLAAIEAPPARTVVLHGVTRAVERADLAFTVGGRLAERRVALGDRVRAGEVLAALDRAPFGHAERGAAAGVADLEARLAQLGRDRARLEAMTVGESVSRAELERVRTEEEAVAAALDGARARLAEVARQGAEAVLRAPYDGVVVAVLREPGEAVAPGAPVLRLAGGTGLEIEVQAPERVWAALRPGDPAEVRIPALGRAAPATVRSVAGAAGPTGLLPVVVALDGGAGLVAGLTAEVALPVPITGGVAVPVGAVVDPTGADPAVLVVRDGIALRVPVVPRVLLGDEVVVEGPLAAGDPVVVAGQARLVPGDRVVVTP